MQLLPSPTVSVSLPILVEILEVKEKGRVKIKFIGPLGHDAEVLTLWVGDSAQLTAKFNVNV